VAKGVRSITEEHVADLRRPRLERAHEHKRSTMSPASRPSEVLSVVPWPLADVALRPIEEYAVAAEAGGAR
jgi:hypothetical protein